MQKVGPESYIEIANENNHNPFSGPHCRGAGEMGQHRRRNLGQGDPLLLTPLSFPPPPGGSPRKKPSYRQGLRPGPGPHRQWHRGRLRWIQVASKTSITSSDFFVRIGVNGFENPLRDFKVTEFKSQVHPTNISISTNSLCPRSELAAS